MTVDLSGAHWFKSSRSQPSGECVEVAFLGSRGDHVGVRDSKNPHGPALIFPGDVWDDFIASGIWRPDQTFEQPGVGCVGNQLSGSIGTHVALPST